MSMRSWLRSLSARSLRKAPRSFRPSLELLEDRVVPVTGFGGEGTGWTVNGNATINDDVATLTTDLPGQRGSVYHDTPVSTADNFEARFTYTPSGNRAADGFTFVLQNAGLSALGGAGGNLGYAGISPSIAVAFNIFSGSQIGTALYTNGVVTGAYESVSPVPLNSGFPIDVALSYDAGTQTLTQVMTDATFRSFSMITYTVDLDAVVGNSAFVGFTGATGGVSSTQQISNFFFDRELTGTPVLTLEVIANTSKTVPGLPVGSDYGVTNTGAIGSVGLTNLVITDDNGRPNDSSDDFQPGGPSTDFFTGEIFGDNNRNGQLDHHETWSYQAPPRITQLSDTNPLVNVVTVTANPVGAADVMTTTGSDSVIVLRPEISVEVSGPRHVTSGQSFRYTYTVRNHSVPTDLPLGRFQLVDDNGTPRNAADDLSIANGKIRLVGGDSNRNGVIETTEVWKFQSAPRVLPGNARALRNRVVVTANPQSALGGEGGFFFEVDVTANAAFAVALLQQRAISKRDFIV